MSWGTYFTMTHYFNRETYTSLGQVESELEDTIKERQVAEADLQALAMMTEPKKFIGEDSDPIYAIRERVKELVEEITNCSIKIYMLSELKEYWDECHKKIGDVEYGIEPSKSEGRNSWEGPRYYCSGDFIKSCYPDGTPTEATLDQEEDNRAWAKLLSQRHPQENQPGKQSPETCEQS